MKTRGRPRHPDVLTPRQQDVLRELRRGLTNEEIAGRLGISPDGVKFHVSEILARLGVSTRYEAAAWRPEPQPARRAWALALTPFALLYKVKWNAMTSVAAGVVAVALAAGIALLAWGIVRTHGGGSKGSAGVATSVPVQTYDNPSYGVELQFPSDWVAEPNFSTAYASPEGRASGFVQLNAASAANGLDEAVNALAHHKLKPYGDAPTVRPVELPAGRATLILPDPGRTDLTEAALVMPFPEMLRNGVAPIPTAYPYLILYARSTDIESIARTLRFVTPEQTSPPNAISSPGEVR